MHAKFSVNCLGLVKWKLGENLKLKVNFENECLIKGITLIIVSKRKKAIMIHEWNYFMKDPNEDTYWKSQK